MPAPARTDIAFSLQQTPAFFSYAHADDTHDRLSMLQQDLVDEYRVITGTELLLFFDRRSLEWGDRWKEAIKDSINDAPIFIPVLSPSYFASPNCVEELTEFFNKARQDGAPDLLLPILYVDMSHCAIQYDTELYERVCGFQYEDWRELRNEGRASSAYKRAVTRLATRIAVANERLIERAEETDELESGLSKEETGQTPHSSSERPEEQRGEESNQDGFMESLADLESQADTLNGTLQATSQSLQEIGGIFESGTQEINRIPEAKRTAKQTLPLIQKMSVELQPAATRYLGHAKTLSATATSMNRDIQNILALYEDTNNSEATQDLREKLEPAWRAAREARMTVSNFLEDMRSGKRISRSLQKPLGTIEQANVLVIGSLETIEGWAELGS